MGNSHSSSNENPNKSVPKANSKMQLLIRSSTWMRESHGLFDYESKTVTRRAIRTSVPGRIVRTGHDIHLAKENSSQDDNGRMPTSNNISSEKELAQLVYKDGHFWIQECKSKPKESPEPENSKSGDDGIWVVVKSLKTANANRIGYKLEEGDLIKLGRVKFRIKEMRGGLGPAINKKASTKAEDDPTRVNLEEVSKKKSSKGETKTPSQTFNCRICLGEDEDVENPFVSPCKCTGTMAHVHIKCLQHWLKSRLQSKQTGSAISYHWKSFECELCKCPYPNQCQHSGKKYDLIDIPRPDSAYLMLEILHRDQNAPRGVHIINMATKTNIRLVSLASWGSVLFSVSRYHGIIKLEKGNFYLEDNNSKFGTLVQLPGPLKLAGDWKDVSVQIGRTMLNFTIQKKKSKLMSCFRASNSDTEDNVVVQENYRSNDELFAADIGNPQQSQPDDDGLQVAEEVSNNSPDAIQSAHIHIQLPNVQQANPSNNNA